MIWFFVAIASPFLVTAIACIIIELLRKENTDAEK